MEINSATGVSSSASSTSGIGSALGKDDFLKILVAQLQNQDPTKPMDDTQFIAQMAQFSALEQMQQLNTAFSYSRAYSLLGRNVSVQVTGEDGLPKLISGTVSGVTTIQGTPYLNIDGDLISMEAPITVTGSGSEETLLQAAALIGKYVKGVYLDENEVEQQASGIVEKIAMQDGSAVLYVNGHAVKLGDVTEVSPTAP